MSRIKFEVAKMYPDVKIPSKHDDDMGLDIYAYFDEDYIEIKPNEIVKIHTGIKTVIEEGYSVLLRERGSTGTKGMSVRAGVIEYSYRGEWLIPINNTTNKTIYIVKEGVPHCDWLVSTYGNFIEYPYENAICQAIVVPHPYIDVLEVAEEVVDNTPSHRGSGKLGSSGK